MVFLEKKNVCQIFSKGALLKNKQICRYCRKLLESSLVVRKKIGRKKVDGLKKKASQNGRTNSMIPDVTHDCGD